ncbi:hypothetical protein FHS39_002568 [Streptomyces olivoverticillatus]|uniref:Uncharacterized protein n=1 Tax=Streptomyces olivoverticillatus TaxID=66427 RepID=A0A7W7PKS5_9ACTN|nr:hypothetical protein [Streptomyces olivoverticillatus]
MTAVVYVLSLLALAGLIVFTLYALFARTH